MAIAEAEYLEQRLDDQIKWYDKKSSANQAAYKRLRLIEIIAAATIPLLAGYTQKSEYVGITIGVPIATPQGVLHAGIAITLFTKQYEVDAGLPPGPAIDRVEATAVEAVPWVTLKAVIRLTTTGVVGACLRIEKHLPTACEL